MNSLYHIQSEYVALIRDIEQQGGELTPEQAAALDITQDQYQEKGLAYCQVIRERELTAEAIEQEVKRLESLKKRIMAPVPYLKERLKQAQRLFGPLRNPLFQVSTRKSKAVVIDNPDVIPLSLQIKMVTYSPDKVAIRQAIESGKPVPGARLVENENLQIK